MLSGVAASAHKKSLYLLSLPDNFIILYFNELIF